jgi:hypothetical protein
MDRMLGVQVVYIPTHIYQDLQNITAIKVNELLMVHPNLVQAGFITEVNSHLPGCAFVRYWAAGRIGIALRTTANSELTAFKYLVVYQSTDNGDVKRVLKELGCRDGIDVLFDL